MTRMLALLFVVSFLFGCNCSMSQERPIDTSLRIGGEQYLLNATDFDLQQVIALIRDNKIKDAADLEKQVNETSGLNNVDVDHDGKIDYVKIKESRKGSDVLLEFLAVPSSTGQVEDSVTIASVNFARTASSNDVQIQGGYANHVSGHDSTFYSARMHGPSFTEMLFLAWLFTPSRPYYYAPVMPAYAPQPVNYTRNTRQPRSDIKQSAKPSSFDAGSSAPKRSFASIRNRSRPVSYDTREVRTPRPTRSSFRGFRRR